MGNDQSTVLDEERRMLESLYQISEGRLDRDVEDVNRKVNSGTSAPNCQPRHTVKEIEDERRRKLEEEEENRKRHERLEEERLAGLVGLEDSAHLSLTAEERAVIKELKKRGSTGAMMARNEGVEVTASGGVAGESKRPPKSQEQQEAEKGSIGSYVQMAKSGYQELVNAIIRPPRANYREEHLGPPTFNFLGKRFTRTDFTLQTKRGLNLQCSHWEPIERQADRIPVVVYMHGNASARVEALPQLCVLLALGVAVFAFDFAGSGKSDGEYVTLGYYEREDLMCVVAHLRATNVVSTIALWGRSMGAVTALMHGDRDPSIAGMVLDSPFSSLTGLCEEMVDKAREQGINVPGFVSAVAIRMIRGSVRRQADFDIKDVSPVAHVGHCFIPALFVAAENDDFIPKSHSLSLHDAYAGDANMIVVDGDHNTSRPRFMFDSVSIFLQACLQIPPEWSLRLHPSMNITAPPWMYPGKASSMGAESASMLGINSPTRPAPASRKPSSAGGGSGRIDLEEEAAAALAAELDLDINGNVGNLDQEDLGMTMERQKEIQGSLFRMLGHNGENENEGGGHNDGDGEMTRGTDGEWVKDYKAENDDDDESLDDSGEEDDEVLVSVTGGQS